MNQEGQIIITGEDGQGIYFYTFICKYFKVNYMVTIYNSMLKILIFYISCCILLHINYFLTTYWYWNFQIN